MKRGAHSAHSGDRHVESRPEDGHVNGLMGQLMHLLGRLQPDVAVLTLVNLVQAYIILKLLEKI